MDLRVNKRREEVKLYSNSEHLEFEWEHWE